MGLLSFLGFNKKIKEEFTNSDTKKFEPSFWEDDYCQTEIIPIENKEFVLDQLNQIQSIASNSKNSLGYNKSFERRFAPVDTLSKRINSNTLERTFSEFQFLKAEKIIYNNSEVLDCHKGNIKANGFSDFIIFYETDNEWVSNIWIHIGLIVSVSQFKLIESALLSLGLNHSLLLIDWQDSLYVDLTDKIEIRNYLMRMFK